MVGCKYCLRPVARDDLQNHFKICKMKKRSDKLRARHPEIAVGEARTWIYHSKKRFKSPVSISIEFHDKEDEEEDSND